MKIYEEKVKIYLLKDISKEKAHIKIAELIDKTLCKNEELCKFHKENKFKGYCFNSLYPLSKSGIYKEGNLYTFIFRTVDLKLSKFIKENLRNEFTEDIKVLTIEEKIIPERYIEKIYSITPVILKTPKGYWNNELSLEDFERRIFENLVKNFNQYFDTKIDEDFKLYDNLIFDNKQPVPMEYKGIKLLGDKVTLFINSDERAQKLAQFALGASLGEMSARGAGFVNYKWL